MKWKKTEIDKFGTVHTGNRKGYVAVLFEVDEAGGETFYSWNIMKNGGLKANGAGGKLPVAKKAAEVVIEMLIGAWGAERTK